MYGVEGITEEMHFSFKGLPRLSRDQVIYICVVGKYGVVFGFFHQFVRESSDYHRSFSPLISLTAVTIQNSVMSGAYSTR